MMLRILTVAAVLAAAPAFASVAPSTTTIYDATGGSENGGDSFATGGHILVDEVRNVSAATLYSVTLNVRAAKPDLGSFEVVLTPVSAKGTPLGLKAVVIATVADKTLTNNFGLITVTPSAPVSLLANRLYYVGIRRVIGARNSVVLGNTVDPTVLSRASVVAGGNYYNSGGVQANSGGPYEIKVETVVSAGN